MSIYTLKGINNNAIEITKCSQKKTVKTEKERRESSVFTQQLSSITGENVNSKNIQNTINNTSEGANLEEMLGVYLTKSGKASNATITNEKGQTETVSIKDLSLNELKAVAKGDTSALKERDAQIKEKAGKKSQEAKDQNVTAENQARPDYQQVVFGGISAKANHIKTYQNTDDVKEFAQATKSISDMSDANVQTNIQAGGGDPLNGEINAANGDKIIANASQNIKQLKKDSKQIVENMQEFNVEFQQDSSKTKTLHNKSESYNKKAEKKKENTEKKITDDAKEIANTKTQAHENKTVANNAQNQTNPIKSASNNSFLGLTKSAATQKSTSTLIAATKSTGKVSAKNSTDSVAANKINNNISKTNEAQNTLIENNDVINDTATKAQAAQNYAEVSTTAADNAIKVSDDFENQAKAMAENSSENASTSNDYQTNAEISAKNAEISKESSENLQNKSNDTQAAALAYRAQATENAQIAMNMKVNNDEQFENISLTELMSEAAAQEAEEDIADAEDKIEHGEHTKNKGAQYERRGRTFMAAGDVIIGGILMRRGHNIDKKGRSQINEGSRKKFRAETAKLDAENKIAEVNRQREEYNKDVNNEQTIKAESKAAAKKSKNLGNTSKSLKDQSIQQSDNQKTNEKAASSFANVAKSYKEKSNEQDNLASLNAALANNKTAEAQEYSSKAGIQQNIGLKLETIAQNQETKQASMAEKVIASAEKNDKTAKQFNENQKAGSKQTDVEKFRKEEGAQETEIINKNEENNNASNTLDNEAQNAQDTAAGVDNSLGLLVHADRNFVSHLVFGVENNEETNNEEENQNNDDNQEVSEVQENQTENNTNNQNDESQNVQPVQSVQETSQANLNIKKLG